MGALVFGAFRALPLLAQLGSIALLLTALGTGYGIWHHKVYVKGWKAHEAAIVREDDKVVASALKKRNARRECIDGGLRWDVITGKCQGR
jgi:hypothetical protein